MALDVDCDDCPHNAAPCHTLHYYATNSNFTTSNAIFYFLEGEHVLESAVEVMNVANLSLVGTQQNSSKVLCGGSASAGFFVRNFENFNVKHLSFLSCGMEIEGLHSTFILLNGSGLYFDHITISNSTGYGLAALSLHKNSSISNSVFSNNQVSVGRGSGNVIVFYSSCSAPSRLSIDSCKILNGYGNDTSSSAGGLTLNINCTDVYVTISNSTLNGNTGSNIIINFLALTGNFIRMSNVITSNGSSFSGPGVFIKLDENLPIADPISCGTHRKLQPNYLMEMSNVAIFKNTGLGALYIEDNTDAEIECNSQYVLIRDSKITENMATNNFATGTSVWLNTKGMYVKGKFGIIQATFKNVSISASTTLRSSAYTATVYLQQVLNVTFIDCTFENNKATSISATASKLVFQGNHTFTNNSGYYGAGLLLIQDSYLFLNSHTHITFAGNHAFYSGGAIFVNIDDFLNPYSLCFLQADPDVSDIRIDFANNTAGIGGSSLYIPPSINDCAAKTGKVSGIRTFLAIFNLRNTESDPSAIASDPTKVCACSPGHRRTNCYALSVDVDVYPGEDFNLSLAVTGTMTGVVPGTIVAHLPISDEIHLGPLQESQLNKYNHCTNFTYTVFSNQKESRFGLMSSSPLVDRTYGDVDILVKVHFMSCPVGFTLHQDGACTCDPVIMRDNIQCFINNQSILRPANTWIGFIKDEDSSETGVVFHDNCPHGYCLSHDVYLSSDDLISSVWVTGLGSCVGSVQKTTVSHLVVRNAGSVPICFCCFCSHWRSLVLFWWL